MTLNEWIRKSITRPHAIVATLLLSVWFVFAIRSYFNIETKHYEYVDQTASLLSIPVQQQNRIMAESLLEALVSQGGASSAEICKDGVQQVAVSKEISGCTAPKKIFERLIEQNITGSSSLVLRVTFNIFNGFVSILFTLGLALLFIIFAFFFVQLVQKRIQDDLLNPLKNNFLGSDALKIEELNTLRNMFQEAKEVEAKKAVALAIQENNIQVAHDIRSPMQSINVLFKFIKIQDEQLKSALEKAIERVNLVANSLLKQEHYVANEEKIEPFDIVQIVEDIAAEKRPLFKNGKIEIDGDGTKTQSKISSLAVSRILSNLIDNAIQACVKNGKIDIQIAHKHFFAEVSIRDSGQGIPKEMIQKLGEKGFSQKSKGNGLGVYAAKKALEKIGGSIQYDSTLGKGTIVTLRIPIIGSLKKNKIDLILIDNDELNHMTWNIWAEANNLNIANFSSVEEFMGQANNFQETIPLFLDYNLDNKKTATHYLDGLNALGFKKIIIATGDQSLEGRKFNGAIAIISKNPEDGLKYVI